MAKLAVIVGATGGQGNSVVKALLKDPSYKVRGTTLQAKRVKLSLPKVSRSSPQTSMTKPPSSKPSLELQSSTA